MRIGAGEEFRGEGILAVTKALLQSGVGYVAGYQGSPISHLMDVLADANEILQELGVHFEASASEATAAATLAASVMYPIRGAVTWKSTVGTNVASDALANLASGGVTGGALVIVGEDYGEGSSIMQERSHAFAMKSQIWLLDPRPNLESMVKAVEDGFSLSEASKTPVMLQLRIRGCHVHGRFIAKENKRPAFSLAQALESPARDTSRIVLPPASFLHEQEKIKDRWPAAIRYIKEHKLNEHFDGDQSDIGLILQGGLYNGVIRALQLLGLADHFGNSRIPLYVMNVTYPVIEDEVIDFCRDKRAVLLLEEGQPDYIEQNLHAVLRKAGIATQLSGKDVLPMAGEYTTQVMREGLREFLRRNRPESLQTHPAVAADAAAASTGQPEIVEIARARPAKPVEQPITFHKHVEGLAAVVPPRPAGFCTGCPERPIFSALTLAQETLGQHHISCDIGCHLFSILPPFNLGATTMGYGLGASSAAAFNVPAAKRPISIMGDGGFWHNGLSRASATPCSTSTTASSSSSTTTTRRPPAAGHPVLARREPRPLHQQPHRPRRARRGRAMGAHAGSHLRRGQGARHHRGSAHHRRQGPQGHHRAVRVHAEQAAPHQAAVQQGGQGRQARGQGTLRRRPRRLHRRPRLYPAVRLPLADRQGQRRSAKGRPGRARGKQLRGLRQLR